MRLGYGALIGLIATMPLAVEVPTPADSGRARGAETHLRVAGGYAYYAFMARGCGGQIIDHVPVHAVDGGGSLDHRFAGTPLKVGVRGGWTRDKIGRSEDPSLLGEVPQGRTLTNRYVNPFIELDEENAGFSIGPVFHDDEFITADEGARTRRSHSVNDVSAHVRIGRLDGKYGQVSWMEGVPIYSDGGYLTAGVGAKIPDYPVHIFGGFGAGGPMEGAGPMVRGSFDVTDDLKLNLTLHGNMSGAATVGLGAAYRIKH